MRILFFLASLLFIFTSPACNKDDDNNPSGARLLDHYSTTLYPDTYSFDYNGSDQIVKTENEEDRTNIDISGNQLHFTEYRKQESREVANATFTLNAQGNIISGHGSFSYNQSSPYTADITYVYDGAGNLVSRTYVRSDSMTYAYLYTWANGDVTEIAWTLNNNPYLIQYYEYDLSLEDKLKLDEEKFQAAVNSFVGNANQHLPKRRYTIFANDPTIVQDYTFTYSLDSEGFPDILTVDGVSAVYHDVVTYHY
jgi:YD repeat-containing protein